MTREQLEQIVTLLYNKYKPIYPKIVFALNYSGECEMNLVEFCRASHGPTSFYLDIFYDEYGDCLSFISTSARWHWAPNDLLYLCFKEPLLENQTPEEYIIQNLVSQNLDML